jgi:hypothetical protein
LYIATISDLKFMVRKVHDLMTLEEYIHRWKLEVWGIFFSKNSSPRMFVVTKPRSNNLEERRPSKEFFIGANSNLHLFI